MKVDIYIEPKTFERLTPDQLFKIRAASRNIRTAVNSDRFKHYILNHHYRVKVVTKKFLWFIREWHYEERKGFTCTDLSNEGLYAKIMTGAETLNPTIDNTININLKVDRKGSKRVLGYTYPNSVWQWVNSWFLNSGKEEDIRGNLFHEWCHKIGLKHPKRYSFKRQNSVPYQLGYFVRDFRV